MAILVISLDINLLTSPEWSLTSFPSNLFLGFSFYISGTWELVSFHLPVCAHPHIMYSLFTNQLAVLPVTKVQRPVPGDFVAFCQGY